MTIALLDACVLYPPALRDVLLWLAAAGLYSPRWTDTIHEEWIRNVLENRPNLTREQLHRTRTLMDQIDPQSLVTGYETRIPSPSLPDPDDRHVLAAAIEAGAAMLVTFNLADFPHRVLDGLGLRAIHPDPFLCMLLDQQPGDFLLAVAAHRGSLKPPPKSAEDYLGTLRQNRLVQLAARLEPLREHL